MRFRNTLFTAVCSIVFASAVPASVYAACNTADPCGPKKKVGEWDKSLAAGFNLARGNTDTMLLTILGKASLEQGENLWDFGASYGYGEDSTNTTEDEDATTRNDLRADGSYRHLLSDRTFVGFGAQYRYDEIADIDYRVTLSPNVGYFFLKDDDFKLSFDVGPSYIFERVGGEEDNYLAPRVGERFEWVISCTSKIYQTAEYIQDVNDSENYLLNGELGIEAALNSMLSLVLVIRDNYDNQPAEDREKNDLSMISALKVTL